MDLNELKNNILTLNRDEMVKFIEKNFDSKNTNFLEENYLLLEQLSKSDLEIGIARVERMDNKIFVTKTLPFITAFIILVVTSYGKFLELSLPWVSSGFSHLFLSIIVAILFFYIAKEINKLLNNKSEIVYFKELLKFTLNKKHNYLQKDFEKYLNIEAIEKYQEELFDRKNEIIYEIEKTKAILKELRSIEKSL